MKVEAEFLRKEHRDIGIWIDFYETKLTDRVIQAFVEMIQGMAPQVTKLGIVGCSMLARRKINRLIEKTNSLSSIPVKYFEDPEVAKSWLVSELE
jgi:hypothetical protein